MQNTKRPDVIIVGAGAIGICSALSLVETGVSVLMIDRDEPGQGASFGNAGIISPWSIIPQATPNLLKQLPGLLLRKNAPLSFQLNSLHRILPWGLRFLANSRRSKFMKTVEQMSLLTADCPALYRSHLAGTGSENLIADSYYVHAFRNPADAVIDATEYRLRRDAGAPVTRIEEHELRDLEPDISSDFRAAILIGGQARAVAPGKIFSVLANKAMSMGVKFAREEVRLIESDDSGEWVVTTSTDTHKAAKCIVSAGAWSAELLKPLGYQLPLMAERGYHVEYARPDIKINNSVMDVDYKVVASSMEGVVRVAGTSELGSVDQPANPRRFDVMHNVAGEIFPTLREMKPMTWMGIRPTFPDGLPVISEMQDNKGLFGAFGHSHYGLMMAPKTGRLVAGLISGQSANLDLSGFSSSRF